MKLSTINLLQVIGISLVYLGMLFNWNVMISNDGLMPVKYNGTHYHPNYEPYENASEVNMEKLADRYRVDAVGHFVIFSVGDVLIAIGMPLIVIFGIILIWRLRRI